MFYSAIEAQTIVLIVLVALLVLVLVVMPIFTNKKRAQAVNQLHGSLKIGDKIMTIGGIIGTVVAINQISPVDKEIMIETGSADNKTTMLLDIKALYQVMSTGVPADTQAASVNRDSVFNDEPAVKATEVQQPEVITETVQTVETAEESVEEAPAVQSETKPKASARKPIAKK